MSSSKLVTWHRQCSIRDSIPINEAIHQEASWVSSNTSSRRSKALSWTIAHKSRAIVPESIIMWAPVECIPRQEAASSTKHKLIPITTLVQVCLNRATHPWNKPRRLVSWPLNRYCPTRIAHSSTTTTLWIRVSTRSTMSGLWRQGPNMEKAGARGRNKIWCWIRAAQTQMACTPSKLTKVEACSYDTMVH